MTVAGFLGYAHLGPIQLHLDPAYDVIHLVITVFALWAGFGRWERGAEGGAAAAPVRSAR